MLKAIAYFNELLTFFAVFPAILLLGFYFTWKLKCVQVTKLKLSFSYLLKNSDQAQGNISHYEAISAVLAGNFGTGNISGMAVAVATGGPGALVWMWVMAFFGSVIQYASCVLGVEYRQQNSNKEYVGGPMYYLSQGLGQKWMAILFSIFAIIAAFTVGNFTQINSVILPLEDIHLNPIICSLIIALMVGVVILGGIQRLARTASSVVPLMAAIYLGAALVILAFNANKIGSAFMLLFNSAIDLHSVAGGALGYGLIKTISTGFGRGIFATDAGTGIAPMIQSSAKTTNSIIDGVVALIAPFLVMIVCTITGLVLIVTDAWQIVGLKSTNMCTYAFEQGLGSKLGVYVVIISLLLFAYTTILAWSCCGERAVEYLFGKSKVRWFQYLYIALVPVGAFIHVDVVWMVADLAISLMLVMNLAGLAGLSGQVIQKSNAFFEEKDQLVQLS